MISQEVADINPQRRSPQVNLPDFSLFSVLDTDLISPKHAHKTSYFDIQVSKKAPMFSPPARAISAKAIKPYRFQLEKALLTNS